MADIIIDATQYTNLKTTYSEKNNIDNVKGTEYRVTGIETVDFEFANDDPYIDETGLMTINYVQHENDDSTPSYSFAGINESAFPFDNLTWDWDNGAYSATSLYSGKLYAYLRTENYVLSGTLRAHTSETIQDINSISASCDITYNSYHQDGDANNQIFPLSIIGRSTQNPVFEIIRKPENQTNVYQDQDGQTQIQTQTAEGTSIPYQQSTFTYQSPVGLVYSYSYALKYQPSLCEFSKPRVTTSDSGTEVEVDYKITIWFGSSDAVYVQWGIFGLYDVIDAYLDNATSIQFKVQGKTIQTEENNFKYGDGQYKEYELETNELMQYEKNQEVSTRQSYISSQRMLDKTQLNRMILSFDLLDCNKIVDDKVIPSTETNPEIKIKRYLEVGDLIKIKDQNGDFIGQYYDDSGNLVIPYFEIISYHGRWDGTFHVEIVCKQKF